MTANMGYSQSVGDNRVQERDYTLLFYLLFPKHIQEVQQHFKSTLNTLGWRRKEKKEDLIMMPPSLLKQTPQNPT